MNETTKTPEFETGDRIRVEGDRGGLSAAAQIWVIRDAYRDGYSIVREKDGKRARAYGRNLFRIYSINGPKMTTLLSLATFTKIERS